MMTCGILWAVIQDPQVLTQVAPRYEVVQGHHMTLQYGVELEPWAYLLGLEFTAQAIAECWNDRIQALRVQLPPAIPCSNLHPHLTLSHRVDVEPKESNLMLAGPHESVPLLLQIPVRVEFYVAEAEDDDR